MRFKKDIILVALALIALGCNSNNSDDACDCLKKAANTYMLKGEKASEYQLTEMCEEFRGKLKDKDKRKVFDCLTDVKKHIEEKTLFTDVEKVSFEELPKGRLLGKEINMAMGKYNDPNKLYYYLSKRPIKGTIVIIGATDDPNKINWGNASKNDPKNFLVKNGKILVNGYIYDGSELVKHQITILIPEADRNKIIAATDKVFVNEQDEWDEAHMYGQIINFEGVLNDVVENSLDQIRPVFEAAKYEFIKPNEKIHKISNESKSKFSYSQNKTTPLEEQVDKKPESKEDFYMYAMAGKDKVYFYSAADPSAIENSYIIKGEGVKVIEDLGNFYKVIYTNAKGKEKVGFMSVSDLQVQ